MTVRTPIDVACLKLATILAMSLSLDSSQVEDARSVEPCDDECPPCSDGDHAACERACHDAEDYEPCLCGAPTFMGRCTDPDCSCSGNPWPEVH